MAAANACAWLQGANEKPDTHRNDAWLNIGIAGHGWGKIGAGFLAHRIREKSTGQNWYPAFTFDRPCQSSALTTVIQPECNYRDNELYDMEAVGFYSTCTRFSSIELVHCFKVVSDNHNSGIERINEAIVEEIIQDQLTTISHIIEKLTAVQQQLAKLQQAPHLFHQCLKRWNFSHYQGKQLHQYLSRWQTLTGNKKEWPNEFEHAKNAKQLLIYLQQQIEQHPVIL